ncbi:MAG: rod shape-determining protein MreC [Chloroflexi bacterium]|jgi:rod shape-determining protein MreC|nr:rod shape-determining protein MreC [Chloroflexota bacterium]
MIPSSTRSLQTIVLGLVVVGLIALALSGYLAPLTGTILQPLVSAQTWIASRYQAVQNALSAPQDVTRLRMELELLEAENARLEAQIIELNQQLEETRVLSALLDFVYDHPQNRHLAARVIGRDPSAFMQYVFINRGSDDGLRRGMPVVTQHGLVGRIAAVSSSAARVQLITDPASRINVVLEDSRAAGILVGQITAEVSLDRIPQDADVKVGELILTSGLGGNYPPNIVVGQVTGVRSRDYDIFKQASVQPIVDFSQLDIVLVITNFQPVDISPLQPTD